MTPAHTRTHTHTHTDTHTLTHSHMNTPLLTHTRKGSTKRKKLHNTFLLLLQILRANTKLFEKSWNYDLCLRRANDWQASKHQNPEFTFKKFDTLYISRVPWSFSTLFKSTACMHDAFTHRPHFDGMWRNCYVRAPSALMFQPNYYYTELGTCGIFRFL